MGEAGAWDMDGCEEWKRFPKGGRKRFRGGERGGEMRNNYEDQAQHMFK